jgi:hypothetical protein
VWETEFSNLSVLRQRDHAGMKLAYVHAHDLVEVNKGGRRFIARVIEIRDGVVEFEPVCRGISYRHASARELVTHWRKTGRRGPGPADEPDAVDEAAVPREQLSLRLSR